MSDDGSALYIDERRIIDNDCMHQPITETGSVRLDRGIHDIRVGYFQGPRWQVALVLSIRGPGEKWKLFDTDEYKSPTNPAEWSGSKLPDGGLIADPCKIEKRSRELITRP